MSWMELDDGILDHPKFIRAVKNGGSDTVLLWLGLRAHCAKLLTDGLIETDMIDEVRGPKDPKKRSAALAVLKEVGLIDDDPLGIRMHNYLKWSKSRAQVLAQREAARARQTKFRGGNDGSNGGGHSGSNGVTSGVTASAVPRSKGEEWCGDGEASDLGSGSGSTDLDTARDLKARASRWVSDPVRAALEHPNPEKWPETRVLVGTLTDVFGGSAQIPRHAGDPRMRVMLERWAEGRTNAELLDAIRGAALDDQIRAKPQLQTLTTILRDSGQVDRYARLLTVSPVAPLPLPQKPKAATGRASDALDRQMARAAEARAQEAKSLP